MNDYRFRWTLITVPLAGLFMIYLISGASTSFSFPDLSDAIGIVNGERWTGLIVLAVALIGLVLVLRILLHRKDD
jgi:hypothetical protein